MSRLVLAAAALAAWAAPVRADAIDKALLGVGEKLVAACVKAKHKTVGAARFPVKVPGIIRPNYIEPLSSNMADRIENLLIIADEKKQLNVIRGMGAQTVARVEKDRGEAGAIFPREVFAYPHGLAWGKDRKEAEAYVTGKVTFTEGLKEALVEITLVDSSMEGSAVASFRVPAGRDILADVGQRFTLPDVSGAPADLDAKAREQAVKALKDKTGSATPAPLVSLEAIRDKTALGQERGENGWTNLRTPEVEGELSFKLTNNGKGRVAVVLRVAGRAAIERQTEQMSLCRRVSIEPGKSVTLAGHLTRDVKGKHVFKMTAMKSDTRSLSTLKPDLDGLVELAVFVDGKEADNAERLSLRGFGIDGLDGRVWTRDALATELKLRAGLRVGRDDEKTAVRPDLPPEKALPLEGAALAKPRFAEYQRFRLVFSLR